jgi:hypothetical protein
MNRAYERLANYRDDTSAPKDEVISQSTEIKEQSLSKPAVEIWEYPQPITASNPFIAVRGVTVLHNKKYFRITRRNGSVVFLDWDTLVRVHHGILVNYLEKELNTMPELNVE